MTDPSALIVMTTYNGEQYVCEQIESIKAQTFENWVLYVSDDGSSDSTVDILRVYAQEDSRIVWTTNIGGHGAYANFHSAVRACKNLYRSDHDYYFFADQDDCWRLDKLQVEINRLQDLEDRYGVRTPLLCYSNLELMDQDGIPLEQTMNDFISLDLKGCPMCVFFSHTYIYGTSTAFNRALWDATKSPLLDENEVSHDNWYAKHAVVLGKVSYIDQPLVRYRRHISNVTPMPKNYRLVNAIKHFFSSFPQIIDGQARIYWTSLQVLYSLAERVQAYEGLIDVFERGGLTAVKYMRQNHIKVSQNTFRQMSRYIVLGLSLHKRTKWFKEPKRALSTVDAV